LKLFAGAGSVVVVEGFFPIKSRRGYCRAVAERHNLGKPRELLVKGAGMSVECVSHTSVIQIILIQKEFLLLLIKSIQYESDSGEKQKKERKKEQKKSIQDLGNEGRETVISSGKSHACSKMSWV